MVRLRSALCYIVWLLFAGIPAAAAADPAILTAVIPTDAPPTYYRDEKTGKPDGFAVDIMNAVAERAGLKVTYTFEDGWTDIIGRIKDGTADLAPGMGVSVERAKDLAFTAAIDTFPISFFVRSEHKGIDATPGPHVVGVIRGSVAAEMLKDRPDLQVRPAEEFAQGLFELLAGKIDAFACPAPTLWQLARESGVENRIKVVDRPIAEIVRTIAVRKGDRELLERLNAAIGGYVGSSAYRKVYSKWYGAPVPYWNPRRIISAAVLLLLAVVIGMAGWRYLSITRLNRNLRTTIVQRSQAEDELRMSNAFNQSIVDSSSDCIKILDMEGRLHYMSAGGQKLLGITSMERYLDVPYDEFWKGSDQQAARDAIARAQEGNTGRFQGFCATEEGTPKWWDVVISPILGRDKRPERLLAVSRDITERRQAAETIRLNKERLESLLKLSQLRTKNDQDLLDHTLEEAIALTRSKLGYIYHYDEEKREFTLNTWSREVMQECSITEPQTVYQLEKTGIWGEAVRQRKPIVVQHFQDPHPLKKGYPDGHAELSSFLTVPVFQRDRIVAVVGVANKPSAYDQEDINQLTLLMDSVWRMVEHKRIESELKASEKQYRELFNSAIDGILLVGMDGKLLDFNLIAHERLGYTREEMMLLDLSRLDAPEYADRVGERIGQLMQQGQLIFESAHVKKDGSIMPVEINSRVIDYDGGKAFFSIVRDITERKTAERERERLIADLQKALAEIKTLHGILPICSSCKKIRDDSGAWHQMEVYIRDHTDAEFTHGLCTECATKLYPEFLKKKA